MLALHALAIPLVMVLLTVRWQGRPTLGLGIGMTVLLVVNALGNLVPQLPDYYLLRDLGLAMYVTVLLWLVGIVVLWKRRGHTQAVQEIPLDEPRSMAA